MYHWIQVGFELGTFWSCCTCSATRGRFLVPLLLSESHRDSSIPKKTKTLHHLPNFYAAFSSKKVGRRSNRAKIAYEKLTYELQCFGLFFHYSDSIWMPDTLAYLSQYFIVDTSVIQGPTFYFTDSHVWRHLSLVLTIFCFCEVECKSPKIFNWFLYFRQP